QIVSNYQTGAKDELLNETVRLDLKNTRIFWVFYYRSANPKTIAMVSMFHAVPDEELKRDFAAKVDPEEISALSVHALLQRGAKNVYVSNLPMPTASRTFSRIESRVEEMLVVS